MTRPCTVCVHKQRRAIDAALLEHRVSYRAIADDFGLAESSVKRHQNEHLAEQVRQSKEAKQMLDIAAIGKRLTEMEETAAEVLAEDRKADHRLFYVGMEARGRNLERLYRMGIGADLEARLKRLEDESEHSTQRGAVFETPPTLGS